MMTPPRPPHHANRGSNKTFPGPIMTLFPSVRRRIAEILTRPLLSAAGFVLVAALAVVVASATASDPRRQTAPPDGLRSNVPQTFALTGADIVVRPGEVLEGATLVIRDGRIMAVGVDAEVPAGAKTLDMTGKRIYAGFIDGYAKLSAEQSAKAPALGDLMAANYWNSNVVPQINAAEILAIDERQHDALRKAGFVARLYAPSAGVIRGTTALVSTAEDVQGETAVLRSPVAMAMELRPARGFGRSSGYPSSPMGAFALVRQALYDTQWYEQAQQAISEDPSLPRPERNDALAALQPVVAGEVPVLFESADEMYVLRADKVADEFELKAIVVGSGSEYRRESLVAETGRPMILPVNFPKPPDVSTPERADSVTLETMMTWDLAAGNLGRMKDAGMMFALTTQGLERVDRQFHPNLKKAIARGLPADAALAALTTDAAEILGVSQALGTLEPGKIASFVITDGDLFAEKGKAKVLETWVDGRRDLVVPDPVVSFRGTWKLEGEEPMELKITGRPEKLNGEISRSWHGHPARDPDESATRPDDQTDRPQSQPSVGHGQDARATAKLKNVRQSADRLSFTVDAEPFGQKGVAIVSLTQIDGKLTGTVVLPDGSRQSISGTKTRASTGPSTQEGDDDEIEAEMAVEGQPPIEATEGEPTEAQTTPEGEYAGGTTRTTTPEEGEGEGGTEMETVPTTGPTTVAAADENKEPLYEPNYPLGAFGREEGTSPEQANVDLMHATVWTCGEAGIVEDATVSIRDGKIAAVTPTNQFMLQSRLQPARLVDATGMHITPGIIDAHSHIASSSGINEGTQAVTAEVRLQDYVNPDDINIYRQLAGGTTISNTLHGSANPIGGQNVIIKFRWGQGPEQMIMQEAPQGVKFALGENVKQSNWDGNGRYPQTRMGVPEILADSFRAAQDYLRAKEDYEANGGLPVRKDLELDALVEMLSGERLIHCHSYRQDEILATIRVLEEFGITVGSFQHILEGYKVAREMAEHGATASGFSDWWAYKFEVYDAIPYAGAIMHNAGVVTSFNSDDAELARRLNLEAAKAVKYGGVPEEEALKFVTLNPAISLGIDEYVGSLEAGKHADLVVWNGPPLSTKSRVVQTWIDGRKYFDREEDLGKRDRVREMRSAYIQRILSSGEEPGRPGESPVRESALWPNEDIYCGHGHQIQQ